MFGKRKIMNRLFAGYDKKDYKNLKEFANDGNYDDLVKKLNDNEPELLYDILVLSTKCDGLDTWYLEMIPKIKKAGFFISSVFANYIFAYRKSNSSICNKQNIEKIIDDNIKAMIITSHTKMYKINTEGIFDYIPLISFKEEYLKRFLNLEYGNYITILEQ